jgi:predicted RNase H-like HicB family nuclease
MRYTVVLERELDGGYVVSVPALPGCVSQGDTRAEALSNIRQAIELYLQDCICKTAGMPTIRSRPRPKRNSPRWKPHRRGRGSFAAGAGW